MAKTKEVKAKRDLYKEVTQSVVQALKGGSVPWATASALPYNAATKQFYHGINVLSLWLAQSKGGYPSNAWMTYKQAEGLGGQVRKGERGVMCVKYSLIEKTEEIDGKATIRKIPYLTSFVVFNLAQIDGLPENISGPSFSDDGAQELENLLSAHGAKITPSPDTVGYDPIADTIQMPDDSVFADDIQRVGSKAHVHVAWTAHASRCDRSLSDELKDLAYEELVSELGAAFLCAAHGICNAKHHAECVQDWIELLESDCKILFKVTKQAKQAAEWLMAPAAEGETILAAA